MERDEAILNRLEKIEDSLNLILDYFKQRDVECDPVQRGYEQAQAWESWNKEMKCRERSETKMKVFVKNEIDRA